MLAAAAVETPPSCVTHRQPATIRNGMVNIEHEIACCMLNTQQYTLPRNPETRTNENGGQVSSVSHSVARNAYNKLAASCLTINHICPFFEYGSVVFCLRRRRCCRFQVFSFYLLVYIYICDVARYTMHNARSICAYWHTHTQCEWEPFIDWILCRWYANCKSPNTNNRGMALWFERTKTWSRERESIGHFDIHCCASQLLFWCRRAFNSLRKCLTLLALRYLFVHLIVRTIWSIDVFTFISKHT